MKVFTYKDYLKYRFKIDHTDMLQDESTSYELENVHQSEDKLYKSILDDKTEATELINRTLNLSNTPYAIHPEEIEKYNSSFINQYFKSEEADIIYKKKDEDIFFLIEHQSKIDYSMAYRILNYNMAIIRSAINLKKLKNKSYKMPMVYPIVLYTGKRKWNAEQYFQQCQLTLPGVPISSLSYYNLVDINDFSEEELWKSNNFLSKILILEKFKDKMNIEDYLIKLSYFKFNNKEINILTQMIQNSIIKKIGPESVKNFINKINKKECDDMSALEIFLEKLIDESIEKGLKQGIEKGMEKGMEKGIKKGIKQGIEQNRKSIILKMLKNQMDDETIILMTEISREKLETIKQSNC